MTDTDTKAGRVKSKALRAWANQVLRARSELEGVKLSPFESTIVETVHWFGMLLAAGEDGLSAPVRAIVLRVEEAYRPERDAERLALAHHLVHLHVQRDPVLPYLAKATPEYVAVCLVASLEGHVHDNFGALPGWHGRKPDNIDPSSVCALLRRYTPTKDHREGSLTAAGIVAELNVLAGFPFGRSITSKNVSDAARRYPM